MITKLDAIFAKAGRKASREVLKRAARAANYSTDSINPLLSEQGARNAQVAGARPDWKRSIFGQLAQLMPASAPGATDLAPQNAFASPRIEPTDLQKKTGAADYWRRYEPGAESEFDRHFDKVTGWRNKSADDADDPEMAQLRASLDRWARKPRLRSGSFGRAYNHDADVAELRALLSRKRLRSDRSIAMDAAIAASATTDRAVPKVVLYRRLQPTQTVEQALGTIDKQFGRLKNTCDFLCLKYVLQTLPPKSLLREMTAGQQQGVATVLARLELAA